MKSDSRVSAGCAFLFTYSINNSAGQSPREPNSHLDSQLRGFSPQMIYTDRASDRRLSAKLVPTLADRGCRVLSATIPPQSLNLGFI
jgi:hypothetical protein